jgi:dTDP-4-amino-4,6-dideoxygalactose transaminase
MPVPLLDLKAQFRAIESELRGAMDRVLASQQFIMGPEVEACEQEIARYCGCRHGIGVSSGTDALLAALMVYDIGPGDEVITSAYTFFSTAGVVARLGAKTVFVDIVPDTYNMDPALLEQAVTPRTKAIIPVHLYGQCADMNPILDMARRRGIPVIEDAAQAIGAEDNGRRAGSMGAMGCLSFFPSKNLGAFGDGGMVMTNDDALAEKLRVLRVHGAKPKYHHKIIGGNFRLDALQAAVVRTKLKYLEAWIEARRRNAARYDSMFTKAGVAPNPLRLPRVRADGRHVFNQYVVRVPRRDAVRQRLGAAGIGTEVYYPVPLHLQECFADLGYKKGSLPHAESAARETLALPIYPELTEAQIGVVVEAIVAALAAGE